MDWTELNLLSSSLLEHQSWQKRTPAYIVFLSAWISINKCTQPKQLYHFTSLQSLVLGFLKNVSTLPHNLGGDSWMNKLEH